MADPDRALVASRMSMKRQRGEASGGGGIGVMGLLGVAFVVLKLMGHIDWSWWLVTLPFWGGIVLVFVIAFVVLILIE